ncbi:MAG: hypothetical protein ACUBOA_13130 [Candidatus Loosdrechtia sp.]|uniref:hypothetical protein n=1 Tax=Candidatus Loosdrechtia sp. TaxID=3101272 RepID=UPI00403AA6DE
MDADKLGRVFRATQRTLRTQNKINPVRVLNPDRVDPSRTMEPEILNWNARDENCTMKRKLAKSFGSIDDD